MWTIALVIYADLSRLLILVAWTPFLCGFGSLYSMTEMFTQLTVCTWLNASFAKLKGSLFVSFSVWVPTEVERAFHEVKTESSLFPFRLQLVSLTRNDVNDRRLEDIVNTACRCVCSSLKNHLPAVVASFLWYSDITHYKKSRFDFTQNEQFSRCCRLIMNHLTLFRTFFNNLRAKIPWWIFN